MRKVTMASKSRSNAKEPSGKAKTNDQRDLLRSSVQLAAMIQGIKDYAIFMLDPKGNIASWNSGAERIKGHNADEVVGSHFSRFYTEGDREADAPARALREAANGKFEEEGWRVRKDGSTFWASVVIDAIHDKDGKLIGFAKVTRDITEKKAAEDALRQAQERSLHIQKLEAVGQLTGGVAHDFNNLLMVILGHLEIAQRSPSAARQKRAMENAAQGAKRAVTLTQRLLSFARKQPLSPKPIGLNKFLAGEAEFLQRTLGEKIEVEVVGYAGIWPVETDANHLETALLNLALNARDAMPGGGKLTVETSNTYLDEEYCRANPEVLPGQYVLIAVSDTGTGMTEEILNRAFEPFFSTKELGEGTGLGLSQVYGFIKQSGGHIKLYSELGEGTTVKIYLPRLVRQGDQAQDPNIEEPVLGEGNETILIVEDDEGVRSYLVETLHDLQYRVLSASEAETALKLLEDKGTAIDLLLADVILPKMNGRELAKRAQSLRPGLKVLFMTGYSWNAIVHQGRLDAGVEMLQKPITRDHLGARIRALLDRTA
jgi:PAS domain S-box-containing protein